MVCVSVDLSSERQKYLYEQVRPYVADPWKDILCPAPLSTLLNSTPATLEVQTIHRGRGRPRKRVCGEE